uniref:Uncharacterized protein n=1 Tax=Anguilla anguilla TaxID=7936 RepID=A0A0E9S8Q0_ANGAN
MHFSHTHMPMRARTHIHSRTHTRSILSSYHA